MPRRAAAHTLADIVDPFVSDNGSIDAPAARRKIPDRPKKRPVGRPRSAAIAKTKATRICNGIAAAKKKERDEEGEKEEELDDEPPKEHALEHLPRPDASDVQSIGHADNDENIPPPPAAGTKTKARRKRAAESEDPLASARKDKPVPRKRSRKVKKDPSPEPPAVVTVPELSDDPDPLAIGPLVERPGHGSTLGKSFDAIIHEDIQLEHKNELLRRLVVDDAERNFNKLKKSTDARARAYDDLIDSLKDELATQRKLAGMSKSLMSEVEELRSSNEQLTSEMEGRDSQISDMQLKIKRLSAKLEASRASSSSLAPKVPGSSDSTKDALIQRLKDLHSDLTGLIIREAKHSQDEDIYDCLQVGRNGTLHFHLAIPSCGEQHSGPAYDDAECEYTPKFDENRDGDLMRTLPDYLRGVIYFRRCQLARFYSNIQIGLSRKLESVDDSASS